MTETRPALVPLTFDGELLEQLQALVGRRGAGARHLRQDALRRSLLFTHRGLSGPAILQISSYWREGGEIAIDLLPGTDVLAALRVARQQNGKQSPHNFLATLLPRRLAKEIADTSDYAGTLGDHARTPAAKTGGAGE